MVKTNITKQSILSEGEFNLSDLSDLEKIEQLMTLAVDEKEEHDQKFLSDIQHVLNNLYKDARIAMRKYNLYPSDFIKNTMDSYKEIDLLEVKYEANIHFESEKELLESIDIEKFIYDNISEEFDLESKELEPVPTLVMTEKELSDNLIMFSKKCIAYSILKKDKIKNTIFTHNKKVVLNELSLNIYISNKEISNYDLWEIIWNNVVSDNSELSFFPTRPTVIFNTEYLKEVIKGGDSVNYNREKVLSYQRFLTNGYCFSCGEDMIENVSVKHSKENSITSCPKCSRTMVE